LLKKKKYQEQLIEKTSVQLDNVEQLIGQIENAQIEKKVFDALKSGTQALQDIQKEMKIEDVEKLMEETQDAIAYQDVCYCVVCTAVDCCFINTLICCKICKQEITRILSEKLTNDDEDDIASELDKLESSMTADSLAQVQVPQTNLPVKAKKPEEVEEEPEEEPESSKLMLFFDLFFCML